MRLYVPVIAEDDTRSPRREINVKTLLAAKALRSVKTPRVWPTLS